MSTHFKHDVPSPSSLVSTKLQLSGQLLVSPTPPHPLKKSDILLLDMTKFSGQQMKPGTLVNFVCDF